MTADHGGLKHFFLIDNNFDHGFTCAKHARMPECALDLTKEAARTLAGIEN